MTVIPRRSTAEATTPCRCGQRPITSLRVAGGYGTLLVFFRAVHRCEFAAHAQQWYSVRNRSLPAVTTLVALEGECYEFG